MPQTTVFHNNRTQAVRLPKAVALPDSVRRVNIIAVGRNRLITPVDSSWDSWFDSESVSDDFMTSRDQLADQERELL